MAVTNIGIYSYLSSGYTLQEAPVAALERRVDTINGKLTSLATIEQEAVQRISAMDEAYRKYVDELYIRRAEKYRAENSVLRAEIETRRDEARAEIQVLELNRSKLTEAKVAGAAKLGSIEHIAAFAGSDSDSVMKVVVFFTILLMMGLDPAAVMLVVLFSFLLSRKVRDDEQPADAIDQLDDDTKAAVEHLDKIGYLKRRKGRKT